MSLIVLAVCTRGRPRMLADCLSSVLGQTVPDGVEVRIVVADNNPERSVADGIGYEVVHQPDPGIPQARNAALARALELGADWMAFIDDDETAGPGWLAHMTSAAASLQADVVQGGVRKVYPEGCASWRKRGRFRRPRGAPVRIDTAVTNNVLFRLAPVRRLNLRFDERLRFIGGEDAAFFRALHEAGYSLWRVPGALVEETVPPERVTVRWMARNAFRKGVWRAVDARLRRRRARALRCVLRALGQIPLNVLGAIVMSPVRPSTAMYMALSAMRRACEAAGCIWGALGFEFEFYKSVTGE